MKNRAAYCLGLIAICSITTAWALPTAGQAEWNGNVVYIRVANTGSVSSTCKYVISVTFKDGMTYSQNGQTDPPTGGTNSIVTQITLAKQVASALVTSWNCVAH